MIRALLATLIVAFFTSSVSAQECLSPAVPVYLVIAYTGSCVVFTHTWHREIFDAIRKSGV